ncbi:MAG: TonB-dependent receptor plug domain-containing protein [Methanosarcina sp.]
MRHFLLALCLIIPVSVCRSQITDTSAVHRIYSLGEVLVSSTTGRLTVTSDDIRKFQAYDAGTALKLLPSVVISSFGSRNESTVYIHGFDTRSIPVFLDGIPVYVPYDGYVDLSRFTTFDISRIDVSKGFSPVSYGANTAGGVINLVTRKPSERFEMQGRLGRTSGNGYQAVINAGSNLGKIYFQTALSATAKKYFPLSASFDTAVFEKDRKRDNSGSEDIRFSFKAGYTPVKGDEYSINYIYSHGEKGNPVYLGNDLNTRARFWKWPYWDKQSIYYISRISIGPGSFLKLRAYYDEFSNKLSSFDDQTYTTQNKKSSFDSFYNDNTVGGNAEFSTSVSGMNQITFSAHAKNDNHREYSNAIPVSRFSDNTFTVGMDDVHRAGRMKITSGLSYNSRISLRTQTYDPDNQSFNSFPSNKSYSMNVQTAAHYKFSESTDLEFSIAWKNRFATMKDRYSYRLGTGIPNPDLKPEKALNLELASSLNIGENLQFRPEIFLSRLFSTIQLVSNAHEGLSQMQNTGNSLFSGLDLTMRYTFHSYLQLYATYTYIRMQNLSNPELLFIDVPHNKFFFSADFLPESILNMNISAEYSTGSYSASDGTRFSPGFFLINSGLIWHVRNSIDAEAGIRNIFDTNYSLEEGYPEPGRNFYISMALRFNHKEP